LILVPGEAAVKQIRAKVRDGLSATLIGAGEAARIPPVPAEPTGVEELSRMNVLGIPGVDTVLEEPAVAELLTDLPRDLVVACIRECVDAVREQRMVAGETAAPPTAETAALVAAEVAARLRPGLPSLRRAVNGTGVIIHTNLGRAPLSPAIIEAIGQVARGYCNLEVDVATGQRSHRDPHVGHLLARLAGAEAATVVNNNAAAVVLALSALCSGQRVLCSRGELVEIGGSFRLPEIIACSGAQMVEVGTTNHTRLADYEAALTVDTAAILRIHASNFRIVGFTSDTPLPDLADLARHRGVALIFDAGSGLLLPAEGPPFTHEPVVRQAVADGADIVTFSTDKLLGGPQAGAIVGRKALIQRINRFPLKRALRVGKLTLAGLEAALRAHLAGADHPDTMAMRLILRPLADIEAEAARLAEAIRDAAPGWTASPEPDESSIGGGSLPGETLPTVVLWIEAPTLPPDALGAALRADEPPIFGRYRRGRFGLDLRTMLPGDADDVVASVRRLAAEPPVQTT